MVASSHCSLLLICFLGLQGGGCIPMSQHDCTSELLQIKPGETLNLVCQSRCSRDPTYSWWRVTDKEGDGGERVLMEFTGPTLTKSPVQVQDGGQYACKCATEGPECLYNVSVLPELNFSASKVATRYGDTIDLTCTVASYPYNFSVIRDKHGHEVQGQIRKRIGDYSTKTSVVVENAMEGEFVCSVETHYNGQFVGQVEKSVFVQLYTPPTIIYTTEYIIHSESEFGQFGQLTCMVHISPDTSNHVTWWTNGTELKNSEKYIIDSVANGEEDVVQHRLTVRNLQHSDIRSYLCQLSSDFAIEASQPAWIQVDFRKRNPSEVIDYEEMDIDFNFADVTEKEVPKGKFNIMLLAFCGLAITFAAVGVWKIIAKQKEKDSPLLGYTEKRRNGGPRHKPDLDITPTMISGLNNGSIVKRKLPSRV